MNRQFGRPHDPPTPWQRIEQVLLDAGCTPGHFHTGSGWSDDGPLIYEPAAPGYVLRNWIEWKESRREATWIAVDHAGPNRKAAMLVYEEVLRRAGYSPTLRPVKPHAIKTLLVVERQPTLAERYAALTTEKETP